MTATSAPMSGGLRQLKGDLSTLSTRHWRILAVAATMHMVDCFDLIALSFAGPSISRAWGIPPSQLGILFSAANVGGFVGAMAVGFAARWVDRKPLLLTFVAIVGAGSLATVFAGDFHMLLACRAVTGFALAAIFPVLLSYAIEFQPSKVRATASSFILSFGQIGMGASGLVAAALIPHFGWPALFVVGGAIPLILFPLFARFPPSPFDLARRGERAKAEEICRRYGVDPPEPEAPRDPQAKGRGRIERRYWLPLVTVLLAPTLGSLVTFFMMNWIPTLLEARGLTQQQASLAITFKGAGGVVAILIIGALMDRKSPYFVLGGTFLAAAVSLVMLALAPAVPWMMFAGCALAGGALASGIVGSYAFANLMFPPSMRIGVLATITWLSRVAGMIAPAGAGFVLAAGGSGAGLLTASSSLLVAAALAALVPGVLTRRQAR